MDNLVTMVNSIEQDVSTEELVQKIEEFFWEKGKAYRKGLITEDEFYGLTNPGDLYISLLKKKDISFVDETDMIKNHGEELILDWNKWKRTGMVMIKPWMRSCFIHQGDLGDAVRWFFEVIDILKMPISYFRIVKDPNSGKDFYPDVMWEINGREIVLILGEKCLDLNKLLQDKDPIGKTFTFHFNRGTTAVIRIDSLKDHTYYGTGTISDYLMIPGEIKIETFHDGDSFFYFGRKEYSYLDVICSKFDPLPDPKWNHYSVISLTRAIQMEAEYKIARLPYLVGPCAE